MGEVKYKAAVIGTGRMGGLIEDELDPNQFSIPYGHFSAYQAIEETEVVAIANRGQERLQRFATRFDFSNTYLDYREMIEKEKPDIVSITTPSWARAEPIIFAAENGVRGIYSEKGLCASLAEADRITAALKANDVAFNWGAMRRHHDGYKRMRDAIDAGQIGEPRHVMMYSFTDVIKHHPHTLDLVAMLLGDPAPTWVEGRLMAADDPRIGDAAQQRPRAYPPYNAEKHAYEPPEGEEIADPMVDFFRVGYANNAEGLFIPASGFFDVEVSGTEGRAYSWDNGELLCVRRGGRGGEIDEKMIRPGGESPTVCTIRDIIRQLETGERTAGNIDITMQSVEVQFGLVHSHLQGGTRVELPLADRSLYIPGG